MPGLSAEPPARALPDGLRLRPLAQGDLDTVVRLEAELFGGEAWSPALLRAEAEAAAGPGADRCYVVAERASAGAPSRDDPDDPGRASNTLLGYAGLWFGDGRGDADLLTIATVPGARRRGIAGAMLSHLLERAREAGCTGVLLEVRASNTGAQALYRRHGFAPIGVRRRYYRAPVEDALVMRVLVGEGGRSVGVVGAESVGRSPRT